ncbi:hypothetical protein O6H91_02G148800 [Diphasiastrum complanatum]|uniref:Uncharacterized protein n=1 Tax=Diphasiastrum complanatum TaxID=34168 RepID=A0ACC2ELR0_DIPCM|nr:hypothetical protein O6H91_02G148800 [Diphasiastrum complanatum]
MHSTQTRRLEAKSSYILIHNNHFFYKLIISFTFRSFDFPIAFIHNWKRISKFGRKLDMGSSKKMNARLRVIVFWYFAQTMVFEKSVSASRMLGALPKLGSSTSIMDHMYKTHAVEGIEPEQQISKPSLEPEYSFRQS